MGARPTCEADQLKGKQTSALTKQANTASCVDEGRRCLFAYDKLSNPASFLPLKGLILNVLLKTT